MSRTSQLYRSMRPLEEYNRILDEQEEAKAKELHERPEPRQLLAAPVAAPVAPRHGEASAAHEEAPGEFDVRSSIEVPYKKCTTYYAEKFSMYCSIL